MKQPVQEILTIQKFIYLLNDFHYGKFRQYLSETKALLPLKLIETIRKKNTGFDTIDNLCKTIYGKNSTKTRGAFNQLSSHTLRLSYFLAQNYPSYLLHNIPEIEKLINEGQHQQAEFLATTLLSVAERVEDFQCQILVLKFLAQQSYLVKDVSTGIKYDNKLDKAHENEFNSKRLISALRSTLNISVVSKTPDDYSKTITFFKSFHNSEFISLRIYSRYAVLYTLYYFEPDKFSEAATLRLMRELERDLEAFSYIVFPFLFDLKGTFTFLKLNSSLLDLNKKEDNRQLKLLQQHYQSVLFWKNYLNIPQVFYIAVKATHYLSHYHFYLSNSDYLRRVSKAELNDIDSLIKTCEEFLRTDKWDKIYKVDFMSLRMLYGGLLILSGGDRIKKGVDELEHLLTSYQQMNLAGSTDSIFLCLMAGYFGLKKYGKCIDTYKRYYKTTINRTVYDDNDISIYTYYYLACWLDTHRDQYLTKLKSNYQRLFEDKAPSLTRTATEDLFAYFKVPIK